MWLMWRKRNMRAGLWWEKLQEREHLVNIGLDGMMILKYVLCKYD
jgi:hypothetical protein